MKTQHDAGRNGKLDPLNWDKNFTSTKIIPLCAGLAVMPPKARRVMLRALGRIEIYDNYTEMARASGVSLSTFYNYLKKAAEAAAEAQTRIDIKKATAELNRKTINNISPMQQ